MTKPHPPAPLLFVGLNTIDLQFLVDVYPEPNTKTKAARNTIHVGGPATNAAVAAAHLGSAVDLFTPIGQHPLSQFVVADLLAHRVGIIDPVENRPSQPIFASIITEQQNGDRTVFSYHPQNTLESDGQSPLDVTKYTLALFDGFYPEAAVPIAEACRRTGIVTVIDGGSWKSGVAALLPHMDIAICSNDFRVPEGADPEKIFDHLHRRGVRDAAITRGHRSILFSSTDTTGEIAIEPVNAVDTLGAGDIFHGAFAHFFALGQGYTEALEAAAGVAARSCLSFGTREWMTG